MNFFETLIRDFKGKLGVGEAFEEQIRAWLNTLPDHHFEKMQGNFRDYDLKCQDCPTIECKTEDYPSDNFFFERASLYGTKAHWWIHKRRGVIYAFRTAELKRTLQLMKELKPTGYREAGNAGDNGSQIGDLVNADLLLMQRIHMVIDTEKTDPNNLLKWRL